MRLDEVINGIAITDRRGYFDANVIGITADSRRVRPGEMFVALRGHVHDGHEHITEALKRGAASIMGEAWPESADEITKPNVVLVPDTRRALALVAANFYGQPSRKLLVAGVTGTNGKTTVTHILESIIRSASKRVGVLGTIGCRHGDKKYSLGYTTPDAVQLQRVLSEMVDDGVTHVAMEVSSHALDQQRVAGVHFKVAGFTNLSQDHLDYHLSMEAYFEAKAKLFSEFLRKSRARGRMAVVNIDDSRGLHLIERWGGKTIRVSLDSSSDADVVALDADYSLNGISATIRTSKGIWEISSNLIGKHNLSNILVGVGMALAMGFSKQRILRGLEGLERVPGRMDRVPGDPERPVFVDYAHTPDALAKTLSSLRPLVQGRIIVVFGSGGDRDQSKRPLMGAAVANNADLAVVTNDNPRTEDAKSIALAVEQGLKKAGWARSMAVNQPKHYAVELDRRAAIRLSLDWMLPGDVILVAGKGHENYQMIGTKKIYFDDREEARRMLIGLPPPPPMVFDDNTSEASVDLIEDDEIIDGEAIEGQSSVTGDAIDPALIVEEVDIEPEIVSEQDDSSKDEVDKPPGIKKT